VLAYLISGGLATVLVVYAFAPVYRSVVFEVLMAPALMVITLCLPRRDAAVAAMLFGLSIITNANPAPTDLFEFGQSLAWSKLAALGFLFLAGTLIATRLEDLMDDTQIRSDRFKLIFEHAPAAIAVFDQNLHYIAHTRRWATDYGFPGQDFTGRHHYDVFPEIGEKWKDDHRRNLAGEMLHDPEEAFPRADGRVDYVNWTNVPWRHPDGEIGGIIMATQVVTQQVEQRLMLEQLNQDLEDFAASAAHDLKGPLRRISAFGEMVERRYSQDLPEEARPLIRQMSDSARQSHLLVTHLLEFARLRDIDIDLQVLNSTEVLAQFKRDSVALIKEAGLTLTLEGDANFLGARDLVQQVLRNLLTNSVRYAAGENLQVRITVERDDTGGVALHWRDNGPGFDPQYETRIFKMFEQLETSREGESTGIGLALVDRAMQRMKGRVSAQGNPGEGAIFTLNFLPAR